MTSKLKSFVLFILASTSINSAFAGVPQRIIVVDTDDSPGDSFIDIVQGDDGTLQSLVYESDTTLTFSMQSLQTQNAVLKQVSGKNVIQLQLEQPFDVVHGGHVIVQYLNNGVSNSYKDFRILINIEGNAISFRSDPDPQDPLSDGNQFTSVFNKLFMWKRTFLGKEIGIDHVSPSVVDPTVLTTVALPTLSQ